MGDSSRNHCCLVGGVYGYHAILSFWAIARGCGYEYVQRNTPQFVVTNYANTPDYAIVIIMAVFIFSSFWWIVSARKWFHGPIKNVDDSDSTYNVVPKEHP